MESKELDALIKDGVAWRMVKPYIEDLFAQHGITITHGASSISVEWESRVGFPGGARTLFHPGKAYEFALSRIEDLRLIKQRQQPSGLDPLPMHHKRTVDYSE